jgi:uncharacterized protein (DUF488 family)
MSAVFTVGHSTHSLAEFIGILERAGVRTIADVRAMPRSRTNPQFNADVLPAGLASAGIAYEHIAALGGLRSRRRDVAGDTNGYWENASFHNYADYAMSDAFAAGFARLRQLVAEAPTAVMCAEALWWRCHRRIIADYLLAAGEDVRHIMANGSVVEARMTPAAQPKGSVLVYPQ